MIPRFKLDATKFANQYQGEEVFGVNDIKPLYPDLGMDDNNGREPLRKCDQKTVFIHLIKNANGRNNNLQILSAMHATAEAIGRGGESASQTYREWEFDYLYNVVNTRWKEVKCTNAYAMPRVADIDWNRDWYLSMAMYIMIEKGLYRTPQQIKHGLKLTVYPMFQGKHAGYCTDNITRAIRSALPPAVRDMFSAKSLRQAGINKCSMNPHMTQYYLNALSGHSNGTADSYIDFDDVGRPIPALNALHDKKNLHTPSVVPSLDALGCDKDSALELMKAIFQCNIDKFDERNELYVLKEIFLASLIMHHIQLRKDCGMVNIVSSTLLEKAVDVRITCAESPNLPAPMIVKRWSLAIRKDFVHKLNVARVSVMDAPGKEVYSVVTSLVERMEAESKSYAQSLAVVIESNQTLYTALDNLTCKFNSLADKFEGMVQQHAEDQSLICQLSSRDKEFRQQLGVHSAHLLLSPERGTNLRRKRKRTCDDDSGLDDDAMDDRSETSEPSAGVTASSNCSVPVLTNNLVDPIGAQAPLHLNVPVAAQLFLPVATAALVGRSATATHTAAAVAAALAPTSISKPPRTLKYGYAADQVATGASQSMKNIKFADVLVQLAQRGQFRMSASLARASTKTYPEQHFVVSCLELADFEGLTNEKVRNDIALLRQAKRDTDKVELDNIAHCIVTACQLQLILMVSKNTTRKLEPTITGMGKRVKDYKKRIRAATRRTRIAFFLLFWARFYLFSLRIASFFALL